MYSNSWFLLTIVFSWWWQIWSPNFWNILKSHKSLWIWNENISQSVFDYVFLSEFSKVNFCMVIIVMDMYSKIRAKVILYLDLSSWKFQCISNGIERGQFNWEVQFNRMHHFLFLQQATWKAFCISIRYSTWFKIFCFCLVWIWKRREIHATTWQIHILTGTNLCYNFGKSM